MEQWIAMLLLISAIWLLQIRKISDSVPILAFQSFVLALMAGAMWYETKLSHLFVAALLTLIVKAIIIPAILHYTIKKIDVHRRVERVTSKYTSLLIAIILSVAGFYVTSRLHLPSTKFGAPYLPVSITLMFLGTFIMIDHKKALMQGIGLITIENGLFLVAQSISYGMPMMVELGVFFDMLVTVVIIGILSFRIHSTFESLNIEKMSNLKG
ncbi:hydrogenase [Anoxybacillus sp. J5B_2022]|uniref:hydrogenase n=1 Tax=Anoxybacillus sp. J5B_2022 TaxID=3003246 RepID=UPI0022859B28|nr:hydrogenase [Anoxybacillus sp. J5B_2022]MCZ0754998.1 hydrogenase [Anoxybacillus sp. J5B_2022]